MDNYSRWLALRFVLAAAESDRSIRPRQPLEGYKSTLALASPSPSKTERLTILVSRRTPPIPTLPDLRALRLPVRWPKGFADRAGAEAQSCTQSQE